MSHAVPDAPKPSGFGRRVSAVALALLATGIGCIPASLAGAAGPRVPASRPLVALLHDHVVRARPDAHARRVEAIAARRPLTRVRTVLPVLGLRERGSGGRTSWLRVRLPGRPNGHTGWISVRRTRATATDWYLEVKLSARRVTVFRDGRAVRRFSAVVGKPSTPTPRGQFFIEEALALSPYDAGGPFALATSARSDVLHEFDGGPGQIAIHGTDNLSGAPGTAVSHGCIRLGRRAITWLARRVGGGVPLTIAR